MKTKFYKKWWFWLIISIIFIIAIGSSGDTTPTNNDIEQQVEIADANLNTDNQDENTSVDVSSISYEIVLIDNSNIKYEGKNVIRETLHIVVNDKITREQLFEIAKIETEKYISSNKVNALKVGFYSSDVEDINSSVFTYGYVDYVPNGEWGDAINVTTGDYKTFEYVNKLSSFDFLFDTNK